MVTALHFDRAKSLRSAVIALALSCFLLFCSFWVSGADTSDYHGRGAAIVRLLGPMGMFILTVLVTVMIAVLSTSYLIQALSARPAALIDDAGVRFQTIIGERYLPWAKISDLRFVQVGNGRLIRIFYKKASGATTWKGIVTHTIQEGDDYVDLWVEAARARWLAVAATAP